MKNAIFEVTTLADAISKAGRVAPVKGAEFDRAAGIVIDIDPHRFGESCIVMSTDTHVTIRMVVATVSMGDEAAVWRLPSTLIRGLMTNLPMSGGTEIELLDRGDGYVYLKSGKTKAKLRQIIGGYPVIPTYEPDGMIVAPNLAERLAQVAWASDKRGTGVLAGVHIDGKALYACNRSELAMVPCIVPIEKPITAPLTDVSAIIKNTGEVNIRASETRLQLMPDPYTQASCVLFGDAYPNVRNLFDRVKSTQSMELAVDDLIMMIQRTQVLLKEERLPNTNIEFGDGYLKMSIDTDSGLIQDELEVKGGGQEPFKIKFSPEALRSAAMASGRPTIHLDYGPTERDPVLLRDDADYRSLMMPRIVGGTP